MPRENTRSNQSADASMSSGMNLRMRAEDSAFKRTFLLVTLFWTILVAAVAWWNYRQSYSSAFEVLLVGARDVFSRDLVYRWWSAGISSVYVPVTPGTPTNPSLAHSPERDIVTPSGIKLTLVNLAYMTRKIHEYGFEQYGLYGHITSLRPIRPENAPDEWEKKALLAFELGEKEVTSLELIGNETYFRLMRPLITEPGCLDCHAGQGYKTGDIRGGISVSAPWEATRQGLLAQLRAMALTFGSIWMLGLLGLWFGWITLLRHLSERKRAEEKLRESEQSYRTLADSGQALIWASGPDKLCNYFNRAWLEFTGRTLEQEMGNGWAEGVHPSDLQRCLDTYVGAFDRREKFTMEYRLRRHDGEYHWILDDGVARYDSNGEFGGYIGHCLDITKRKQAEEELRRSEERYRTIIENTGEGIGFVNSEERFVFANRAAEEIFGVGSGGLVGMTLDQFVSAEQYMLVQKESALRAKGNKSVYELEIARPDGDKRNIIVTAVPNADQDQGLVGTYGVFRDISDQKRAEERLQLSIQRLALHIQQTPLAFIEFDLEGRVRDWNPAAAEIFGYSRDEAIGQYWTFIVPEAIWGTLDGVWEALVKQSGGSRSTNENTTKNGQKISCEWYSTPLIDPSDETIGVASLVMDITERKRGEKRLEDEKNLLSTLINAMPDEVTVKDIERRFVLINPAGVRALGKESADEVLGKKDEDLIPKEYAEDGRLLEERVFSTGKPLLNIEGKMELDPITGEIKRAILISKSPIRDKNGTITGLVLVNRDITELKRVELALEEKKRLSQILMDSFPCVALLLRPGSREVVASNQAAVNVGAVACSQCFRTWGQREQPCPWCLAPTLWATGRPQHLEIEALGIVWDAHWIPVTEDLYLHYAFDITERKRSEEAMRQAQKQESIGTLAAGIAHDFNNLLNAMLGQSTLAIGKLPKESLARNHIEKSIKAAERAADLTRQMLAYSGKGKFVTEEIDLNRLVKENVQLLEISVPKTTQLRYELGSSALCLHGDIGQIQQVVMNLIINAGEAMGLNPGSIRVRTGRIELTQHDTEYWKYTSTPLAAGKYALLQVSDNGHGMKPEVLARIFDPFFTTKFTGRGLGLAAVLGIIRGHKGGVRITSEEGKGTRFDVVFPIVETSVATNVSEGKVARAVNGEGKTVLVIDDEPSVLELLTDIFTEAQFKVIGALNPLEGIELYIRHQKSIAMVVLDYSMPVMDGKAAFEELLKINKEVKVLICSGYTEEGVELAFGALRPTGFLEKPYQPAVLLERISQVLSE